MKSWQPDPETKLRREITCCLRPWIREKEFKHLMMGICYVPPKKLNQLKQLVQDNETTCEQKAILARAALMSGYIHLMKEKIAKGIMVQSLCLLATIGALSSTLYGEIHKNNMQVFASLSAAAQAYFVSHRNKQQFFDDTKDARYLFGALDKDKELQQRIMTEHHKWFSQSSSQKQ